MSYIWPHKIRAVIFDNDGTLVDTEEAYSIAHKECTGEPLEWDFKVQMMGKRFLEACQLTVDHCHLTMTAQEYGKLFEETIDRHWDSVHLMPGVPELLAGLKSRGVRMSIATAADERSFRKKVHGHPEMIAMMDHCVSGDHVTRGKPFPDLFQLALERWGDIKPEEALVFEDSPLGIAAANNAGIPAIYVPDPHLDNPEILAKNNARPLLTIKSMRDFDFSMFQWP